MPPEYVLTTRSRGVGQVELLEQLVARAAAPRRDAQLVEPAEHPQVLAAGQVLVDGRVLARQADDASGAASRLA